MKILFFSPYFYPYTSGITTYPFKLFTELSTKNEITVLTFQHDRKLPLREKIKDINIIRIPYLFKISKGFISPQSILMFTRESKKTDLVMLNIPNFEGFPLALISSIFVKKIISLFHCRVVMNKDILSQIISFFLNASMFLQLSMSQTIIGYTEDYVKHSWVGKLFKDKIQTVLPPITPLPVDEKKLREFTSLGKNSTIIGYAGRTSREKGLEYLVNAVDKLKGNYTLLFAGPYGQDVAGEEQYYEKILQLLKKKKIKYHFLGTLKEGALGAFYKSVSLLVLPSVNSTEAFGMVQAESMLAGTPVVTTDLPGVRVPIQLTGMGRIVALRNVDNLTEAISDVLTHREMYANEKNHQKAKELFNAQKTYEFYDTLLNGR